MFGSSPIELLATDAMLRGSIFCNGYYYTAQWLTGTTSALGANATVDQPIQVTSEADFVVQQIVGTSWSAAGTLITNPDYTLNITVSSGRPWFDKAQTWLDIMPSFQQQQFVVSLPFPRLIPAQTTLTLTLANRTSTAANRVTVSLQGFNVYYQTETRQQVFHAL